MSAYRLLIRALSGAVLSAGLWLGVPGAAAAQQLGVPNSAILTVNSEQLFEGSRFGKRIARELNDQRNALAAENRRIEAELTAEEKSLTEQRAGMAPEKFRKLADAFDTKVQRIRKTQDAKFRALSKRREEARVEFIQTANPILAELMREAGAGVILERTSVFLSARAIDITDIAISRIDAELGDGSDHGGPDTPPTGAPEPADSGAPKAGKGGEGVPAAPPTAPQD